MSRQDQYRRLFDKGGRRVTIERRVANSDPVEVTGVRARIRGLVPQEVASGIDVNQRKCLVLAEDVPVDFAPLKKGDYIVVDGIKMMITARPDDQTHRDGDTLLAYACDLAGS